MIRKRQCAQEHHRWLCSIELLLCPSPSKLLHNEYNRLSSRQGNPILLWVPSPPMCTYNQRSALVQQASAGSWTPEIKSEVFGNRRNRKMPAVASRNSYRRIFQCETLRAHISCNICENEAAAPHFLQPNNGTHRHDRSPNTESYYSATRHSTAFGEPNV